MPDSRYVTSTESFGNHGSVMLYFILVTVLSFIWWIFDSQVFYQWSVVGLTTLYAYSFHKFPSRLWQTILDTETHVQIKQRHALTFMDKVLFAIIAYKSLNLIDFSTLCGSWCALLLTTIILRTFVSNAIALDKTKSYGFFVEKGAYPNGCYEYTALEFNEGQWKRLGIVYFSMSPKEDIDRLVKQGITLADGECMQKGNIFSNLLATAFFIIFSYLIVRYLPQIVGDMFPEGHDRVKGVKIYRSEFSHNIFVWTAYLFIVIPITCFSLNEAYKRLNLVSLGGRRLILFLNDQVVLTNGSGRSAINQSLSITTIQCILWPHSDDQESVWANAVIDQTLKLIDVKGDLVALSDWYFGFREVLEHLVTLGVPVRLYHIIQQNQSL